MRAIVKAILAAVTAQVYWVALPVNETPPAQYIAFNIRQRDELYASDHPTETGYTVYVDFYSTTDDQAKADQIKTVMRAGGFNLTDDMPMYEPDTDRWHISTTWEWVGVD